MPTCRVLASKHRFRIFADSLDPCTRISQLLEAWRRTPGQNSQLLFQRTQYSKLRYVNHINQSKVNSSTRISKHHHSEIWQTSAQDCIMLAHVAPRPELDLSGLPYEVDATDSKPPGFGQKTHLQYLILRGTMYKEIEVYNTKFSNF